MNLYSILLQIPDALPVHGWIRVFNADPHFSNSGIHDSFCTSKLRMLPRSRRARFERREKKRVIELFVSMFALQQCVFGVVAMTKLSPECGIHSSVRLP
jgi:hypothetical protein